MVDKRSKYERWNWNHEEKLYETSLQSHVGVEYLEIIKVKHEKFKSTKDLCPMKKAIEKLTEHKPRENNENIYSRWPNIYTMDRLFFISAY